MKIYQSISSIITIHSEDNDIEKIKSIMNKETEDLFIDYNKDKLIISSCQIAKKDGKYNLSVYFPSFL
ncbi:hypothetical protein [Terrisporobacter sp.]